MGKAGGTTAVAIATDFVILGKNHSWQIGTVMEISHGDIMTKTCSLVLMFIGSTVWTVGAGKLLYYSNKGLLTICSVFYHCNDEIVLTDTTCQIQTKI